MRKSVVFFLVLFILLCTLGAHASKHRKLYPNEKTQENKENVSTHKKLYGTTEKPSSDPQAPPPPSYSHPQPPPYPQQPHHHADPAPPSVPRIQSGATLFVLILCTCGLIAAPKLWIQKKRPKPAQKRSKKDVPAKIQKGQVESEPVEKEIPLENEEGESSKKDIKKGKKSKKEKDVPSNQAEGEKGPVIETIETTEVKSLGEEKSEEKTEEKTTEKEAKIDDASASGSESNSPNKIEEVGESQPDKANDDSDPEIELVYSGKIREVATKPNGDKIMELTEHTEIIERPNTQLAIKDDDLVLADMFSNLKIDTEKLTNTEKIKMVSVYFKGKKIREKRVQHASNMELQERKHVFRQIKEQKKELERQNSLREEMIQKEALNDEYHKILTFNFAAAVMLVIWFQVMNVSLFSQTPFAFLSGLENTSPPSFFTSVSFLSSYISWGFAVKLLQGAVVIAIVLLIWTFVSKLAPYVTLGLILAHFWQSIIRAVVYFAAYVIFVTALFYMVPFRKKKLLRLIILYTVNLAVAAIVGGLIARGDELNPYRVSYPQDRAAEALLAWVF